MTADRPITSTNPCCHHDQNANLPKIDLSLVENDPGVQRAALRALRQREAQEILRALVGAKISGAEIARRMGVSPGAVSQWKLNYSRIEQNKLEALRKIAREFGV